MPTVREIEQALFDLAPRERAMDWDNVGHLLGDPDQAVERVCVALDITEAVAAEAIENGCQLIVSHHPIMNCRWLPVQNIREDTPQGHLLLRLLRSNVSAICMHTNLDVADGGVNDAFAAALGLEDPGPLGDPEGLCRVGYLSSPMPLQDFARKVCRDLHANGVRYAGCGKMVHRVAVGGGACGSMLPQVRAMGCDTFLTADLKHDLYLEAREAGMNLLDAGHYSTEAVVCPVIAQWVREAFPDLWVEVAENQGEVFEYF